MWKILTLLNSKNFLGFGSPCRLYLVVLFYFEADRVWSLNRGDNFGRKYNIFCLNRRRNSFSISILNSIINSNKKPRSLSTRNKECIQTNKKQFIWLPIFKLTFLNYKTQSNSIIHQVYKAIVRRDQVINTILLVRF